MPTIFKKGRIRGFTLIELLVVVAILAILAVVGFVVFRNVSQNARDTRSKADINAIAKAYEVNFQSTGVYQALINTNFASGNIPNHYCAVGPSSGCLVTAADKYAICLPLGEQSEPCYTPSSTCFCRGSTQGGSFSGTGYGGGGGGAVCDPYGTLTFGLVGYWKMDEGSGNAVDSSGNGNDGSLNNNPTRITGEKFGNSLSFNEASLQSVQVPNTNPGNVFNFGTNSWTISLWVRSNISGSPQKRLIGRDLDAPPANTGYWWLDWGNGMPQMELRDNNNSACGTQLKVSNTIADDAWHHVVFVFNRSQAIKSYYVDYTDTSGQTGSSSMTCGSSFDGSLARYVGIAYRALAESTLHFTGYIDDVRIYNRALSGPEVATLYNGGTGCLPN